MREADESERRQFQRVQKRIMIKIDDKPGLLLNISRGGMRISSTLEPVKKEVSIKLHAADNVIAAEVPFFRFLDRILPEYELH